MTPRDRRAVRVLHVVASINRRTGGPAVSVPGLAEALREREIDAFIAALDLPGEGPIERRRGAPLHIVRPSALAHKLSGFSPSFFSLVDRLADETIDIIHNHGLWMGPNVAARKAANRLKIPLVVSPRGMVESWSLAHHAARKRIAWTLYERRNLASAAAFHATSDDEADSLRRLRFRQPVAVIPNGVAIPRDPSSATRAPLEDRFPQLAGKKWLLFLSRLHPKKGLDELLHVWSRLHRSFPEWHLIVAGAPAPGFAGTYERLAGTLGVADSVTFTGHIDGAAKRTALARSEFFVLPSHSENFGIVIAEALAHGTPVITTRETPWRAIESEECGWWIEDSPPALESAMREALAASDLVERGARGRRLVEQRYGWSEMARRMALFYRWLLGDADPPEFVRRS